MSLRPGGIIVFAARFSFLGKFWYETKLEEMQSFERLKRIEILKPEHFFKYDKLGTAIGKF